MAASVGRALRNAAPQLLGFSIGLGSFAYVERYGHAPPEVVANNTVLLSGHNGLVEARRWFQRMWGGAGGAAAKKPSMDYRELLRMTRAAFEEGKLLEARNGLAQYFISRPGEFFTDDDLMILASDEEGAWLVDAVPKLYKEGILDPVETVVILNWLYNVPGKGRRLLEAHPECSYELPIRLLKEGSGSDLLLACSLLTHSAGISAVLLGDKRAQRRWYHIFSSTPRNAVVEALAKEAGAVEQVVALLRQGVAFPALLLMHMADSNPKHMRRILDSRGVEEVAAFIAREYSALPADGSDAAPAAEEPKGDAKAAPGLVFAFSALLSADDNAWRQIDPSAYRAVADAVFKIVAEQPHDPRTASGGFHILHSLTIRGGLDRLWLAQKGFVSLAALCLQLHGTTHKGVVDTVNSALVLILADEESRAAIQDNDLAHLARVLEMIENPELADSGTEYEFDFEDIEEGDNDYGNEDRITREFFSEVLEDPKDGEAAAEGAEASKA